MLNQNSQHRYLLAKGVCIADRETKENCILLFHVDSYYVEIYFDQITGDIMHSRTFEDTDELKPYLEQVQIPI